MNFAGSKKCGAHFLRFDFFATLAVKTKNVFVIRNALVKGVDRDA